MSFEISPVKIGNVTIQNPVFLAPMAGASTPAYRKICHEFGSGLQTTELVSARSINYSGLSKSMMYLLTDKEAEGVTSVQLFGSDPHDFEAAIDEIFACPELSHTDIIDINMGCPVPKVLKTGGGSALLKNRENAASVVSASVKAASKYNVPVTVKTRIGFKSYDKTESFKFMETLAEAGASAICVHGRTAEQMYRGEADMNALKEIGEFVSSLGIPFIANGDIKDGESALRMFETTRASAVAVGRAAVGNPWVFEQILAYLKGGEIKYPTDDEKKAMILRELSLTMEYKDEVYAVREMRPSMLSYIKGMPGGTKLKVRLCEAQTFDEIKSLLA